MKNAKKLIIKTLKEKTQLKQKVYNNTFNTFRMICKVIKELAEEYNKELKQDIPTFEFRIKGRLEAELSIGSDLLIFNMHPNIFEFHRSHGIWKISYVQDNIMTHYAGIINIYNFLSDSFKFNRSNDVGYLIGRLFINKDLHYFVEGKRQLGFLYNDFGHSVIDKEAIKNIINSAILYSLDFDILVPPYDDVKIVTVSQLQEKLSFNHTKLGKRLGFRFYADDDEFAS